jgi:hypothetical protein
MKKAGLSVLLGLLMSTGLAGIVAGTTATAASGAVALSGNIEICKAWTPPTITGVAITGGFSFTITGSGGFTDTVVVAPGPAGAALCSPVIPVPAGTDTVTEATATWYSVTSITELPGQSYLGTPNLKTQSVTVTVPASAAVEDVTYTNALVTGYVEVCKEAVAGSGLTGNFTFALSEALASGSAATGTFTGTTTIPVASCSGPIQVPAGALTTVEGGTNLYVYSITADLNGLAENELVSSNLITGTAVSTVLASADSSTQTDVTYTDDVVSLKVCKAWDSSTTEPGGAGTEFPFTITPSATSVAGPVPAPYTASVVAGQCSDPVAYRPGTVVTITEGIVAGTKVESIVPTGAYSTVPNSLSLTGRTIQVIVGTPTTATAGPTDLAAVTFTDVAADGGTLKICKVAGAVAPVGTNFTFTVGSYTTVVPLGGCNFVESAGVPVIFPYNSVQTVTEAASANNAATSIVASPTYVTEDVATTGPAGPSLGTPTLTSELVAGTVTLGSTDTTSSINVTIGEQTVTEATFTDIDPPTVTNPGSSSGTTSSSTSGTNGASADSSGNSSISTSTGATSSVVANVGGVLVTLPTSSSITPVVAGTSSKTLTKAQEAKLVKLQKQLAADKALVKQLSAKHYATHKLLVAAQKHIAALKSAEKVLNKEIALLK